MGGFFMVRPRISPASAIPNLTPLLEAINNMAKDSSWFVIVTKIIDKPVMKVIPIGEFDGWDRFCHVV
jgi:hypothetical protein